MARVPAGGRSGPDVVRRFRTTEVSFSGSPPDRRITPQRAAILEALRSTRTHPTAEELLDRMRGSLPRLSLGTIYRNLQVLVEEGFALKLPASHGSHRFDGDASRHHHVVCEICGHVEDVFLARAPDVLRRVAEMTGYDVYPREMIFHGRCPACRLKAGE